VAVNYVEQIDNSVAVKNVLVSVSDKSNLQEFITGLVELIPEVHLYSTGGTFAKIREFLGDNGEKNLFRVSDYTGQPEMQGGLVKTLDFKIYLGILSERYNSFHDDDLKRTGSIHFDMIIANLYPFKETIARKNSTVEMARANIDIGGPCMLRASAKNYLRVASVCDPRDYAGIIEELRENNGKISFETRFTCARKAFRHTALYDQAIADYLEANNPGNVLKNYSIQEK